MKAWIKRALSAALALALLAGTAFTETPAEAPGETPAPVPEGYILAAEENGLSLYADLASGNFILRDEAAGLEWASAPLEAENDENLKGAQKNQLLSFVTGAVLNPAIGKETRFSSAILAGRGDVKGELTDGGYRLDIDAEGVQFSVEVTLENDCVRVVLPADSIRETDEAWLQSVSLAPSLNAGSGQDEGFMLVPDGSGAIIRFNNGRQGSYNEPVYGAERAFLRTALATEKQDAPLPVYGIEKNGAELLAVIDGGAAAASIKAASAGNGSTYNLAGATFTLREKDQQFLTDDVSQTIYEEERTVTGDLSLRLYPVRQQSGGYMAMADCLRSYLTDELGMQPQTEPAAAGVLTVYCGVARRQQVLGIPLWETPAALTTFEQAGEMLNAFASSGSMALELEAWDAGQILGKALAEPDPASALGGKGGLETLAAACGELNVPLLAGAQLASFSRGGNGLSVKKDAVRTLTQEPAAQYPFWLASSSAKLEQASYLRAPDQLPGAMETFAPAAMELGFDGVSVTDAGALSYSNYRSGSLASADDSAVYTAEAVNIAAQNGLAAVHGGFLFAAAEADLVLDVPSGGSRFGCVDQEVPFYQIALSGLVTVASEPVNLQADPDTAVLWALETGSALSWAFADQNLLDLEGTDLEGLTGLSWQMGGETAAAQAAEVLPELEKVVGRRITGHETPAEGVALTTFDNGVRVAVNYTGADVALEGATVPAMGWYIWE